MAAADDARAKALAESARQFILWLRDNELPGVPGLKGAVPEDFKLFAGIYRKVEPARGPSSTFWATGLDPKETVRLLSLRLSAAHALFVTDPTDLVSRDKTGTTNRNRMWPRENIAIDRPDALEVIEPMLDSVKFDEATLENKAIVHFVTILRRSDLVWDDRETAKAAKFRYPSIFDLEAPRGGYERNIRNILPPHELTLNLPPNRRDEELARRDRVFREYLYYFATYENRRRAYDDGADYYKKWRAETPLAAKDRQFLPTLLSDQFLKECFTENVMKSGENYLYIKGPAAGHVFWLSEQKQSAARSGQKTFVVEPLLRLDDPSPPSSGTELEFPVFAVVFHALEGKSHFPNVIQRGELNLRNVTPKRFAYNYKAALRWYFDDEKLDLGNDARWLEVFVDIFFGDATYQITVHDSTNRNELFLNSLRSQAAEADGALKKNLEEMIAFYERTPKLGLVVKGQVLGDRELIGVSPDDYVYEFWPKTGLVTRISLSDWLYDLFIADFAAQTYRNTAGMLPLIALMTWGPLIVLGGAVVGAGAALGALARFGIRTLATELAARRVKKEVIKKLRPQLVSIIADGLLALMPKSNTLPFEFLRGLLHGFGAGTVQHYLSQVDERLERAAKTYYKAALNKLTKGAYRAHAIYQKISAAVHKLLGVYDALKKVWTDERARKAADALNKLGRHVGLAFLIILFVIVYVDYLYRNHKKNEGKRAADEWAKKQRDGFIWMVKNTGNDIADYARDLRKELIGTTPSSSAAVRERNQQLSDKLASAARSGVTTVAAVADILQTLLAELGIDNWNELKERGLLELLSEGFEAVVRKHPGLKPEEAKAIGEAIGELIGGIALGRKVLPEKLRKDVGIFRGEPHEKALKTALSDGTLRGLWRLALTPIKALRELLPGLARGLRDVAGEHQGMFVQTLRSNTSYRDFLRDLIDDHANLVKLLADLAIDEDLEARIRALVTRVETEQPPDISTLLKTDDPLWPRNAILFLLAAWMHFGLRELLEAFALIEDSAPYGGQFRIAQILELIGLDVALDDKTVAALKTTFSRRTDDASSSKPAAPAQP